MIGIVQIDLQVIEPLNMTKIGAIMRSKMLVVTLRSPLSHNLMIKTLVIKNAPRRLAQRGASQAPHCNSSARLCNILRLNEAVSFKTKLSPNLCIFFFIKLKLNLI